MGWRDKLKIITKEPKYAALLTIPMLGLAGWELYRYMNDNKIPTTIELIATIAKVLSPIYAPMAGFCILSTLNRLTYDKETLEKIKKCKERVKQQQPPEFPKTEKARIPITAKDHLFASTISGPESAHRNRNAQYGRKNKNPPFLLTAATGYITEKEYDEALICVRDALDMLGNKRPSRLLAIGDIVEHLAQRITQYVSPDDVFAYINTAVKSATDPKRSWHYITLAKEVAKELNHKNKLEAYVIDALLATAQQRSDRKKAWKDAFIEMHQRFKPKRLGESRNPVWTLESKDSEFFSGTFAFKGNKSLEELQNEWHSNLKLGQTLDETAVAPQPLEITEEPYNEMYVYIMRYLPGKLLYDQFLKGDKRGLEKVIPVLARIHARYPTAGLTRLNPEEKTAKKLQALGMQSALKYFRPVTADLQAHPIWAVNKDAHPEQWQMLNNPHTEAKVGVLDTEIKEAQPIVLDIANLLYYAGEFTREEREKYVGGHVSNLRKEGAKIHDPTLAQAYDGANGPLLRAVDNAAIFRMLCLIEAWSQPDRPNMRTQRERLVKTALETIDDLKEHDPKYYSENEKEYKALKERFPEFLKAT